VLCVGRLYCDLVFTGAPRLPSFGTEVFAAGLSLHAGGGAFITAAYVAAMGRPAALAAVWPAAPFGAVVAAEAAVAGVAVGLSVPAPAGAEPQVTVAIAGAGDRAFLTRRVGAAAPALGAQALAASGAGHLHIGELTTLAEAPGLVAAARAAGMTVSLDCAWDDGLGPEAAALVTGVDVFLPNAAEAERIAGFGLPGAPLTVVKCGAEGARALSATGCVAAPALAGVRVVDTTGAGDAFNGGFLDAWLDGRPLEACLAAGNRCGAAAVQAAGGTGGLALLREAGAAARAAARG
jgi:sugar/nucleoside kinase (ribokinase family)